MTSAADMIAEARPELDRWIGRKQVVEDDISPTTVARIAAMLDQDPSVYTRGSALPGHWFSMFFANNALQRDIGPDGHPLKGIFLPPIPLPRRMAAGRRVAITGALRVGEPARRTAEVLAIAPKVARTGHLMVLTMRHSIETAGRIIAIDDFDAVYREALPPGAPNPVSPAVTPPTNAAWSHTVELGNALVFRYSAITWNAHRIHYDADYARGEEGYRAAVQNGGLTTQLMLEAAVPRLPGALTGFSVRLMRPLWVGDPVTISGAAPAGGRAACWAVDKDGAQAASLDLEYAA